MALAGQRRGTRFNLLQVSVQKHALAGSEDAEACEMCVCARRAATPSAPSDAARP